MELIGIAGLKGSGKDTVAEVLSAHCGFYRMAFADPLKEMTARMLQIPHEVLHSSAKELPLSGTEGYALHFKTSRDFLQKMGTEVIREHLGPDFWVWLMERRFRDLNPARVVIPDVRFPNEAHFIRMRGQLWHVDRPGLQSDGHASEQGIPPLPNEVVIRNNSTLKSLKARVLALGAQWRKPCAQFG